MDMWMAPDECLKYAAGDVERTYLLWQVFYSAMQDHSLLEVYATRKKLIRIAFDMETVGYNMYADEVREEIEYLKDLRDTLTKQIQKEARIGYNMDLNTEKDKRFFLFTVLKLEPVFFSEKTGVASLNKDAINYMIESNPDIPAIQLFQEYRAAGTQIAAMESYLNWVCDDGCIRSNVFLTGTRNTRQSYTDPNLQSLDKRLHDVFGPPPGYLWLDYDLVNIELRIWVYQVGNQELITIFERGESVHLLIGSITRPELFAELGPEGFKNRVENPHNEYTKTKNGTFALIYGASEKTADAARGYGRPGSYRAVVDRFPEVGDYSYRIQQEMQHNMELHNAPFVTCLGGYRLDVNPAEPYVAPNTKIQGSAGWIMTEGMINIKNNPDYIASDSQMIITVHDSVKVQVPIANYSPSLATSLQKSIEDAGLKYLPTCKASYDIIYHPKDKAPF
jgi:DNA polymerase I-like protein with 3'-5' exonuclease and polymerase domains